MRCFPQGWAANKSVVAVKYCQIISYQFSYQTPQESYQGLLMDWWPLLCVTQLPLLVNAGEFILKQLLSEMLKLFLNSWWTKPILIFKVFQRKCEFLIHITCQNKAQLRNRLVCFNPCSTLFVFSEIRVFQWITYCFEVVQKKAMKLQCTMLYPQIPVQVNIKRLITYCSLHRLNGWKRAIWPDAISPNLETEV